jgi:hypothetical protein
MTAHESKVLYGVMHDRNLPLPRRIKAAGKLMQIEGPHPEPAIKIDPDITPHELLLDVMHNSQLPLTTRIQAAGHLVGLGLGHVGVIHTVKLTQEDWNQTQGLLRLYEAGYTLTDFDMVFYDPDAEVKRFDA